MDIFEADKLIQEMISLGLDPKEIVRKEKQRQTSLRKLSDTQGYKLYLMLQDYEWTCFDEYGTISFEDSAQPHIESIVEQMNDIGIPARSVGKDIWNYNIRIDDESYDVYGVWDDFLKIDLLTHPYTRDFSSHHEEGQHYSLARVEKRNKCK